MRSTCSLLAGERTPAAGSPLAAVRGALLHTSYTISCSYRGTPCRLSCQGARVSAPAEHGMHNKRVSRRSLTRCALHVPPGVRGIAVDYGRVPDYAGMVQSSDGLFKISAQQQRPSTASSTFQGAV